MLRSLTAILKNSSRPKILLWSVIFALVLLQGVYFFQIQFILENTNYLSLSIIAPIFAGTCFGLVIGTLLIQQKSIFESNQIKHSLELQQVLNRILMNYTRYSDTAVFLNATMAEIKKSSVIDGKRNTGIVLKSDNGSFTNVAGDNMIPKLREACVKFHSNIDKCLDSDRIVQMEVPDSDLNDPDCKKGEDDHYGYVLYTVPIQLKNQTIGGIILCFGSKYYFTEKEFDLLRTIAKIIAFFITSDTDQKKIKALVENLEVQNHELEKKNHELDRFIYSTTHDLRSPILSNIGLVELLKSDPELTTYSAPILNMLENSLIHSDETIKGILDYFKHNRLEVRNEPINVVELVLKTMKKNPFLSETDGTYELQISSEIVVGDYYRLETVLNNLFSNAIKYQRKDVKSYINVICEERKNKIYFSIEDNGEGIPEEKLGDIFNMFFRYSASANGSGLGLYICKEMIESMSGTIRVQSKIGQGTKVYFEIPKQDWL